MCCFVLGVFYDVFFVVDFVFVGMIFVFCCNGKSYCEDEYVEFLVSIVGCDLFLYVVFVLMY